MIHLIKVPESTRPIEFLCFILKIYRDTEKKNPHSSYYNKIVLFAVGYH